MFEYLFALFEMNKYFFNIFLYNYLVYVLNTVFLSLLTIKKGANAPISLVCNILKL